MIDSAYNYRELTLFKELRSRNSHFLPKIEELLNHIKPLLNSRIPTIFPTYTLHDIGHSFRIMSYMGKIITDVTLLNEIEITLLIYSALLHDIGMALAQEDVLQILADTFEFSDIKFSVLKKINNYDETTALQEFARRIHSQLSGRYILSNQNWFTLPSPNPQTLNFSQELAIICESHTQDIDWIKQNLTTHEVRGIFSFNSQFIAGVLRLADILDIDESRTPYALYKAIAPAGVSDQEWKQHFVISNTEKIEINQETKIKNLVFYGSSDNPSIHRKLLSYIDWVEVELVNVSKLLNNMLPQYNILFENIVTNNIQTLNFSYSDYKINLDFKAISALLMGEKIYGDKTLGLRELIQNSIDACRLRQEKILAKQTFEEDEYRGHIKVILNRLEGFVKIKDNGIGMSLNVIKRHFLNIGVSYYNSDDFKLRDFRYQPIGNFGIGFLSSFMLSSQVKVLTKPLESNIKYIIDLEKGSEYTSLTNVSDFEFEGTEIILKYTEFMALFNNNRDSVASFMTKYFLTDNLDFSVIDIDEQIKLPIINLLNKPDSVEEGVFKINFSQSLIGIEGYALVKTRRTFIKSFDDLSFEGELYLYNEVNGELEIVVSGSNIPIDDFIIGSELKFLSIPLVPSSIKDTFKNGLEYTNGDVKEVISNLSNELEWISILFPKDLVSEFDTLDVSDGDTIIAKLHAYQLRDLGHSLDCKTRTFINSIDLYEAKKNTLYVPFTEPMNSDPSGYMLRKLFPNRQLYIRNVLIRDFSFYFPVLANIFDIRLVVANITSREFIPNISRNNLDMRSSNEIGYIISKAIHEGAINLPFLDVDEKEALEKFTNAYYRRQTSFEIKRS